MLNVKEDAKTKVKLRVKEVEKVEAILKEMRHNGTKSERT